MVKDRSDSERGNQQLSQHELLILITSKSSFICTIPYGMNEWMFNDTPARSI